MRLLIIRHGETIENTQGIMQGHWHGRLTEKGLEQAEKLGVFLKERQIDIFYSSDLHRASLTAQAIAKHHPEIKLLYLKILREMYLGKLQGQPKLDLSEYSKEKQTEMFKKAGAETLDETFSRAKNYLRFLLQKHKNQTVATIAHSGINKAIIAALTGKQPQQIPDIEHQKNTSVTEIEITGDTSKIIKYNSTEHLDTE